MKHSISYTFYLKMLRNYIIAPVLVCLFMCLLLVFDIDYWILVLILDALILICFLPLIILMLVRTMKAKRAEDWQLVDGKIVKILPEFSFAPKMYMKAIVEIYENGAFNVETYPVLNPKEYKDLNGKEVQIAYAKGKKAYIIMIY